jgi:hypothetical protein
MPCTNCALWPW